MLVVHLLNLQLLLIIIQTHINTVNTVMKRIILISNLSICNIGNSISPLQFKFPNFLTSNFLIS